jgi:H+/gluconate symporter-like permease
MGLFGILVGLAGLIFFAYRGSSILILAPIAGLIAAAFAGYPLPPISSRSSSRCFCWAHCSAS